MSNKVYDILKWIAMIGLPALSTLIFGLSTLFNFDPATTIGVIALVETFLGSIIGASTYQYNKNQNKTNENKEEK